MDLRTKCTIHKISYNVAMIAVIGCTYKVTSKNYNYKGDDHSMTKNLLTVICPYCQKEFSLDEALTHKLKEGVKTEFLQEFAKKERELKSKEELLHAREEELKRYKDTLQADFERKLVELRNQAEKEARAKVEEKLSLEFQDLKEQLKEKERELKQFKEMELKLRKDKKKLEEEKENLELEVMRRLEAEREKIREEVARKLSEQHYFKDQEREKLIRDLQTQIEVLKQKAEQGSQQLQGEVLELELEDMLRSNFPDDEIIPVPKGKKGADILQQVYSPSGQLCGTIIWEAKRTKNWGNDWIEKLKNDQLQTKADIAALVSLALPKDSTGINQINGVWVAEYKYATGLALALRHTLIQVAQAKSSLVGRKEKMDMLFEYISGPEFRQQVEAIVEAFITMKQDLEAEKRAIEKLWAKREKQLEKVIHSTGSMYGSLQGIVGRSLPEIKLLEFKEEDSSDG